ncbi:hybrid sensor histidine kinase/response regulator [Calditrichota bacterium GD2]
MNKRFTSFSFPAVFFFLLLTLCFSLLLAQEDVPAPGNRIKKQIEKINNDTEITSQQLSQLKNKIALQKRYDLILNLIIFLTVINFLAFYFYFNNKRRNWLFFNDIINSLNYPLFVFKADNHKIELANFAAEKNFPHKAYFEEIHDEEKLVIEEWLDRLINKRQAVMHEVARATPEGPIKYYQIYLYPLVNRRGKVAHIVEYWVDTTIQRRALERLLRSKQALEQSKQEFEKVISSIPDAIYSALVDKTGKILDSYYSPVIEKITGYPPSYFNGDKNNWSKIVHPEDLPELRSRNKRAFLEKQNETRTEYRIIHKDGSIRYIRSAVTLNFLENGLIRVDGVLMDVTEIKKTEMELMKIQKLESVGVLAGGIAHDFNNILTAILGNISLARMIAKDNAQIESRLVEAEKACLRAKDLTQQLLTFSKGGTPVKKATSLADMLKEATTFLLRGSNIKPEFEIPENLWLVDADEGQLAQVINNLVINAKQAMPGGGKLNIKAYNYFYDGRSDLPLKRGRYVCFLVEDHGVGIDEKSLQRIFDPYFTTKKTGTGLGLAVTFSIIKKHNGYITAQSKVGKGTTFYVYLPASDKKSEKQPKSTETYSKLRGKVLLMDDEELILEIGNNLLSNFGLEVSLAKNGEEALKKYSEALKKEQPFDLVILDLTIPGGMGGKETIKALQEVDKNVKAIVSSGYSNDPVMANFSSYGFKGMVIKPYRMSEMYEAIKSVLSNPS